MKFHEIVGEFDQFMSELHAICKHDRVFAARIREIARRHEQLNRQKPCAQSDSDNAARMREFIAETRRCCEERASELESSPTVLLLRDVH
jgi:hypothetical protein